MENTIIYDYLTFTSKIHDFSSVLDLLGMSDCNFVKMETGFFGYPEHYVFNDVHVAFGGREDMGLMVSMSGSGCRTFESFGNGDYDSIFSEILQNYSDKSEDRQMNITRLDIAYDDFNAVLDLDVLLSETLKHNFVMRFNKGCIELPFSNGVSDAVVPSGFVTDYKAVGLCLYYGSVTSNTRIRIYDKKQEQERDDVDHWVRCELQLRKSNALGFIRSEEKSIGKKYFGVLNNYLRFVTPSDTDSNKRRWDIADFWKNFLQYENIISVYSRPGVNYDISHLDKYVFGQASGAIVTMIDIVGVKNFMRSLSEARKGKVLNQKYSNLKFRLREFSEPFCADSLDHYLQEFVYV